MKTTFVNEYPFLNHVLDTSIVSLAPQETDAAGVYEDSYIEFKLADMTLKTKILAKLTKS